MTFCDNFALAASSSTQIRDHFSLCNILSDPGEQRKWLSSKETRDFKSRFDALRICGAALYQYRTCSFIFDPDNRAPMWMQRIHQKLRADPEFIEYETRRTGEFFPGANPLAAGGSCGA